jgi:hypothetical protein
LDRAIRMLSKKGISVEVRYTKPIKTTENFSIARIVRCDSTEKKCITLVVTFFPKMKF